MAKIKHNYIILSKKEVAYYNSKFDKITTPIEWVEIMQEIYKLVDIDFYIEWNPVLTKYDYYSDVIPCFKGHAKGVNTDLTGEGRRIYSFSVRDSLDRNNIHRAQTGSGGGGEKWGYDYLLLDIRKFPAMLKTYGKEISEATIAAEKLKFQKNFDNEIETQLRDIHNLKYVFDYGPIAKEFKNKLAALEKAKKLLEDSLQNEKNLYVAKEFTAKKHKIIKPTSPFLDLTKYNQLIKTLHANNISFTLSTETHKAELEYIDFVKNNPELFI